MPPRTGAKVGIVGDPREHRDDPGTDGEPEHGHADRQCRGDERTEGQEQDRAPPRGARPARHRAAALVGEGEEQLAAHLHPQRRVHRQPVLDRDQRVRGRRSTAPPDRGYCTRRTTTRPSGDTASAADGGVPARGERPGRVVRPEHAGQGRDVGLEPGERGPGGARVEEGGAAVLRGHDHLGRHAGPVRTRGVRAGPPPAASPGPGPSSSRSSARRRRRPRRERVRRPPATAVITRHGCRAAMPPRRARVCHSMRSSTRRRPPVRWPRRSASRVGEAARIGR